MNSIAPITARVPYHTMPGNHEIEGGTFKAYRSRFWMPASNDALYHSIDVGNAHFSMISSEMYFAISEYGLLMMPEQFTWLEKDLAAVDRTKSPWLVLMLHRPMVSRPARSPRGPRALPARRCPASSGVVGGDTAVSHRVFSSRASPGAHPLHPQLVSRQCNHPICARSTARTTTRKATRATR